MKKNSIKRIAAAILVIVMMASFVPAITSPVNAAQSENSDAVLKDAKSKVDALIKILSDLSKAPMFKDTLFIYFGPAATLLMAMFPSTGGATIGDVSKKLDRINEEIQGKIAKEADRIISAMDAIPDIIDVRNAKRNITSLKLAIETAQDNMGVDLGSRTKTDEEKLREVAKELGEKPKDWGYGSAVNAVEVLAEDITVKGSDVASAIAANSIDNLYVSMYRYQCTKSIFSGEAIDKATDFVNTTYGIYLNAATTVLQYLFAKKQVAILDGDEDLERKIDIKIESFIDDIAAATEAICEFYSLNRLVYVGNKSDATEHIRLEKALGYVDTKAEKIENIDRVFERSALTYDDVEMIAKQAKRSGCANLGEYLERAGFTLDADGRCYLIAGKNITESGTVSLPYKRAYKGYDFADPAIGVTDVRYYRFKVDCDTLDVYDRNWYEGNAVYFVKEGAKTYEILNITADEDLENFDATLVCRETCELVSVSGVKAVRIDGGNAKIREYAVTVCFEGKAYTATKGFGIKKYQAKVTDEGTVVTLNWGTYNNTAIDWNALGGKEAVVEVRINKGVIFSGDCSNMFCGLVNCKVIETENVETVNMFEVNGMFEGCRALKALDLGTFDTALSGDFRGMFRGCEALEELDLGGFTVNNYRKVNGMFEGCRALRKIVLSAKVNVTEDMGLAARDGDFRGWACENDPRRSITGKDRIAVFGGEGTYIRIQ